MDKKISLKCGRWKLNQGQRQAPSKDSTGQSGVEDGGKSPMARKAGTPGTRICNELSSPLEAPGSGGDPADAPWRPPGDPASGLWPLELTCCCGSSLSSPVVADEELRPLYLTLFSVTPNLLETDSCLASSPDISSQTSEHQCPKPSLATFWMHGLHV